MKLATVFFIVLNLISFVAMSQPGDPGGGGNPTVPITGIEYLLFGGAWLGFRKIFTEIKSRKEQ